MMLECKILSGKDQALIQELQEKNWPLRHLRAKKDGKCNGAVQWVHLDLKASLDTGFPVNHEFQDIIDIENQNDKGKKNISYTYYQSMNQTWQASLDPTFLTANTRNNWQDT